MTILARNVVRSTTLIALYIDVCPCLDEGNNHLFQSKGRRSDQGGVTLLVLNVHSPGDGPGLHHQEGDATVTKNAYASQVILL